ncbi:MAG: hypothetical protein BWX64_00283 [Acidobacteria bacterium ADurb.Bin051]|nr:MAG: hypothetical protein BWX64_00283 [Acidobacteria bacterium ADurb.Bin051]
MDELDREQFARSLEELEAADRAAGRVRTWGERASEVLRDPVPEPWPEVAELLGWYRRLARDANGATFFSERLALLAELGVEDPGEREAVHVLFDAADDTLARVRAEEWERIRDEAEARR